MKIGIVCDYLENWAPRSNAEDYDNVGLLVGDKESVCSGIMVTLDTTEQVLDECLKKKCNLIISFHPIIFSGLKKLTGKNHVERIVFKAIKNDIAIYAIHTALDNFRYGVSHSMAEKLGLVDTKILIPKEGSLMKLKTYVPHSHLEPLLEALYLAGGGQIGNYDQCSFTTKGYGSFRGNNLSQPTIGKPGERTILPETQLSLVFHPYNKEKLLRALKKSHPYEEVAYEVYRLDNPSKEIGLGLIGNFAKPILENKFLGLVKDTFKIHTIRHSKPLEKYVYKIAVLGGSGSFAIEQAKALGADAYVTADLKYHNFFQADGTILLVDVGHYESEQFTCSLILEYLRNKITTFAVLLSETNTNPIHYY